MKRRQLKWAGSLLLLLASIGTSAESEGRSRSRPPRLMMGVMGDSISAASLAETPPPSAAIATEEEIRQWAERESNERIIFENKRTLSWASGQNIHSHFVRLREVLRRQGEHRPLFAENVSYPGDSSMDLLSQAEKIVKRSLYYTEVKYITVLVGANDACSKKTLGGTPLPILRENLLAAFRKLSEIEQPEPVRILLLAIPRIPELGDPEFREAKTIFGLRCETVRNEILHFCDSLLLWKTPEEFDQNMAIVEGINSLLRSVASEVNRDFPTLEIAFSDALSNNNIPLDVMAADCFHPGKRGHEKLAAETWPEQPWYN